MLEIKLTEMGVKPGTWIYNFMAKAHTTKLYLKIVLTNLAKTTIST